METIYFENLSDIKEFNDVSLLLGNFDGVHIGHAQLFNFAKNNSKGRVAVLTFDQFIKPKDGFITNLSDRISIFESLGIDLVFVLKVDDNLIHYSYVKFVDEILKKINPKAIYCGPDFQFGFKAQGDVAYLKERFSEVYCLNYVKDHNNNKISSTGIRNLIKDGKIYEANRWLGRSYFMKGKIVKGSGRGKNIGFPTANLGLSFPYILPKNGVYITFIYIDGNRYRSLTNIGNNPTFNNKEITIETYIFDFIDDLYGKDVKLEFFKRLRDEIKFDNVESLHNQLEKDMDDAIYYFEYVRNLSR